MAKYLHMGNGCSMSVLLGIAVPVSTLQYPLFAVLHVGAASLAFRIKPLSFEVREVAMTAEPRRKPYVVQAPAQQPTVLPFTPLVELDHLLKVAGSVSQDANQIWAEMWGEFRRIVTSSGMIIPEAAEGFVPACGWPEFLEKFWLLKHYLDSIQRICERQH